MSNPNSKASGSVLSKILDRLTVAKLLFASVSSEDTPNTFASPLKLECPSLKLQASLVHPGVAAYSV